jgi:hypothetical protein
MVDGRRRWHEGHPFASAPRSGETDRKQGEGGGQYSRLNHQSSPSPGEHRSVRLVGGTEILNDRTGMVPGHWTSLNL